MTDFNIAEQKRNELEDLYERMELNDITKKEIIQHFIESEDIAMTYKFQGPFYPKAHYRIKDIVKTAMSGFSEEEIIQIFYHTLRLDELVQFNRKNYPLYVRAFDRLLPAIKRKDYYICRFNAYHAFLLYEIDAEALHSNRLYQTSYENFADIRKFILKAHSYSTYPAMRKKREKFIAFLQNETLMQRIKKGFTRFACFTPSDFTRWASLILLLQSKDKASKNILMQWHTQNLPANIVWTLGSFYKDFQDMPGNVRLLKDLYYKYPEHWIDEFQQ